MESLPADNFHACITDPPYSLGFMGKSWDKTGISNSPETWTKVLQVLRPGAHLVAFGGTRTWHRMACAIEDAGFEVRDTLMWVYGQGFPKSHSVLKPAWEPIILARKPIDGTFARNAIKWGCGGLNIDACRIPVAVQGNLKIIRHGQRSHQASSQRWGTDSSPGAETLALNPAGRWPANLVHDGSEEVLGAFPEAPGQQGDLAGTSGERPGHGVLGKMGPPLKHRARQDSGSAARFFYCAKVPRSERGGSQHPTMKPLRLMEWLLKLTCPAGGNVLDPFAGSGTTGIAAMTTGIPGTMTLIEQDSQYCIDIRRRCGLGVG